MYHYSSKNSAKTNFFFHYHYADNRMWRKNRKNPPAGSQCYGIDLNRNYDVVGFGIGASEDPCSDSYSGKKARSEPEVIAASDVVMQHSNHIRVSLSLHSYGMYSACFLLLIQERKKSDWMIFVKKKTAENMTNIVLSLSLP